MQRSLQLHAPSLITGALAVAALVTFVAAQRPVESAARFELEATTNHVFVLDRDTGRVWQKFVTDTSGQSDQDFSQPKIR